MVKKQQAAGTPRKERIENQVYKEPLFHIYGDQGLLMEFGASISPEVHRVVRAMSIALETRPIAGVVESVATYRGIAVQYDCLHTSFPRLQQKLLEIFNVLAEIDIPSPVTIDIPVCYGNEYGPDLGFVAEHNNLSTAEVVETHVASPYLIYMIGFSPGFPFLGGLPETIHTPRLASPRKKVAAGSVGIANNQTGIYPVESPGGWRIIGRTPLKLFAPARKNPFLLDCGNYLRFTPIDQQQYQELQKRGANENAR